VKNKNFWGIVAMNKELDGIDLRIVMLCYDSPKNQKVLCELLNTKKPNISNHVNKLVSIELLTRENIGIYNYKTNTKWSNKQIFGQMVLLE
jgi:DNA-binding Lrp family transcriptional regulator